MAKATTIKDAVKKLEETRGISAAEAEKVGSDAHDTSAEQHLVASMSRVPWQDCTLVVTTGQTHLDRVQIELYGQCPPIEKMDATLSTLKACKWARRARGAAPLLAEHAPACMRHAPRPLVQTCKQSACAHAGRP